jgi:calcium-dependent protein kinase
LLTTFHRAVTIDFGLSKHFEYPGDIQKERVGTPYTVAPEVLRGKYDEKCDLWGVGVLAYLLLSGDAPFGFGDSKEALVHLHTNIFAGRFAFDLPDPDVWATVSDQAKDFIQCLLVTTPTQRPNAAQAQEHEWMVGYQQRMPRSPVSPQIVQALATFKELPVTKRLMFEVISFTLMQDQITHIIEEFEKLDEDGLGELSLENMRQLQNTEVMVPRDRKTDCQDSKNQEESCLPTRLSDTELETIFERIKVGKSEPRVHWHEFVAACLTTCRVNDGNIRIAFDRLDQDHDGYICYDGVVKMIARDADENEESLRRAWQDSVDEFQCQRSRFTYDDFNRLVHSYI